MFNKSSRNANGLPCGVVNCAEIIADVGISFPKTLVPCCKQKGLLVVGGSFKYVCKKHYNSPEFYNLKCNDCFLMTISPERKKIKSNSGKPGKRSLKNAENIKNSLSVANSTCSDMVSAVADEIRSIYISPVRKGASQKKKLIVPTTDADVQPKLPLPSVLSKNNKSTFLIGKSPPSGKEPDGHSSVNIDTNIVESTKTVTSDVVEKSNSMPLAYFTCSCALGELYCRSNLRVSEKTRTAPIVKPGEKKPSSLVILKGLRVTFISCVNSISDIQCQNKISTDCLQYMLNYRQLKTKFFDINSFADESILKSKVSTCWDCLDLDDSSNESLAGDQNQGTTENNNSSKITYHDEREHLLPEGIILSEGGYIGDDMAFNFNNNNAKNNYNKNLPQLSQQSTSDKQLLLSQDGIAVSDTDKDMLIVVECNNNNVMDIDNSYNITDITSQVSFHSPIDTMKNSPSSPLNNITKTSPQTPSSSISLIVKKGNNHFSSPGPERIKHESESKALHYVSYALVKQVAPTNLYPETYDLERDGFEIIDNMNKTATPANDDVFISPIEGSHSVSVSLINDSNGQEPIDDKYFKCDALQGCDNDIYDEHCVQCLKSFGRRLFFCKEHQKHDRSHALAPLEPGDEALNQFITISDNKLLISSPIRIQENSLQNNNNDPILTPYTNQRPQTSNPPLSNYGVLYVDNDGIVMKLSANDLEVKRSASDSETVTCVNINPPSPIIDPPSNISVAEVCKGLVLKPSANDQSDNSGRRTSSKPSHTREEYEFESQCAVDCCPCDAIGYCFRCYDNLKTKNERKFFCDYHFCHNTYHQVYNPRNGTFSSVPDDVVFNSKCIDCGRDFFDEPTVYHPDQDNNMSISNDDYLLCAKCFLRFQHEKKEDNDDENVGGIFTFSKDETLRSRSPPVDNSFNVEDSSNDFFIPNTSTDYVNYPATADVNGNYVYEVTIPNQVLTEDGWKMANSLHLHGLRHWERVSWERDSETTSKVKKRSNDTIPMDIDDNDSMDFSDAFPPPPPDNFSSSDPVDRERELTGSSLDYFRHGLKKRHLPWGLSNDSVNHIIFWNGVRIYFKFAHNLSNLLAPSSRNNPYYSQINIDLSDPIVQKYSFPKYNWVSMAAVFRKGTNNFGDGMPWLAMCALLHPTMQYRFILVAIDMSTCRKPITGFTILDTNQLHSLNYGDGLYCVKSNAKDIKILNEFVGTDPSHPFDIEAVANKYYHHCNNTKLRYREEWGLKLVNSSYMKPLSERDSFPKSDKFNPATETDDTYAMWCGSSDDQVHSYGCIINNDGLKKSTRIEKDLLSKKKLEDKKIKIEKELEEKLAAEQLAVAQRVASEEREKLEKLAAEAREDRERAEKLASEARVERERAEKLATEERRKLILEQAEKAKNDKKALVEQIANEKAAAILLAKENKKLKKDLEKQILQQQRAEVKARKAAEVEAERLRIEKVNEANAKLFKETQEKLNEQITKSNTSLNSSFDSDIILNSSNKRIRKKHQQRNSSTRDITSDSTDVEEYSYNDVNHNNSSSDNNTTNNQLVSFRSHDAVLPFDSSETVHKLSNDMVLMKQKKQLHGNYRERVNGIIGLDRNNDQLVSDQKDFYFQPNKYYDNQISAVMMNNNNVLSTDQHSSSQRDNVNQSRRSRHLDNNTLSSTSESDNQQGTDSNNLSSVSSRSRISNIGNNEVTITTIISPTKLSRREVLNHYTDSVNTQRGLATNEALVQSALLSTFLQRLDANDERQRNLERSLNNNTNNHYHQYQQQPVSVSTQQTIRPNAVMSDMQSVFQTISNNNNHSYPQCNPFDSTINNPNIGNALHSSVSGLQGESYNNQNVFCNNDYIHQPNGPINNSSIGGSGGFGQHYNGQSIDHNYRDFNHGQNNPYFLVNMTAQPIVNHPAVSRPTIYNNSAPTHSLYHCENSGLERQTTQLPHHYQSSQVNGVPYYPQQQGMGSQHFNISAHHHPMSGGSAYSGINSQPPAAMNGRSYPNNTNNNYHHL